MNLQIRQAVQSDIPAIQSLLLQVEKIHCDGRPDIFKDGGVKFTNEQLAQLLCDPTRPIFCAVNDGQVVGYVFCIITEIKGDPMLRDAKTLHLEDVCVDKSCRDGGVGSRLMNTSRPTRARMISHESTSTSGSSTTVPASSTKSTASVFRSAEWILYSNAEG